MILDKIVREKKKELLRLKKKTPLPLLKKALGKKKGRHVFYKALGRKQDIAVISEIKRRSPSKGILRKNFDPIAIAREFEDSGATALSVLTDEKFFGGSLEILRKVRAEVSLPILRKDFILDEYQVYEAAFAGADAILLIAAILTVSEMRKLSGVADRLGLDVLFEVHDLKDLKKVLLLKPKIAGINNRDLRTFHVDLAATEKLGAYFSPKTILVSESGIFTREDIDRVKRAGARAVLVGESLMKQPSPGKALQKLMGKSRGSR